MKWNYDPKEGATQEINDEAAEKSTQDNQEQTEQGASEEEIDPE